MALALWPAAPASACSCDPSPPAPDVVVTGRVVEESRDLFDATWLVDTGDGLVPVTGSSQGAACGPGFGIGGRYRIHARREDGRLTTNACLGSEVLAAAPVAEPMGGPSWELALLAVVVPAVRVAAGRP